MKMDKIKISLEYEVTGYFGNRAIFKFIILGAEEEAIKKILKEKFNYFNINSEGSGTFYFKLWMKEELKKINAILFENINILEDDNVPIEYYQFKKIERVIKK